MRRSGSDHQGESCVKWPLQLLYVTSSIPTLAALFTCIYFCFKCCKMKVRAQEAVGGTVRGRGQGAEKDRWHCFVSPGLQGGQSLRSAQVVRYSALSAHLKYSHSSSGAALILPASTGGGGGGKGQGGNEGCGGTLRNCNRNRKQLT